jgi:hypothetical protein
MNKKNAASESGQVHLQKTASNPSIAQPSRTFFLDRLKTPCQRLRIEIREYQGRQFIDFRLWFRDVSGDWLPSDRGISIRQSDVPEIVRGLMLAGGAIDPKGAN